VPAIEALRRLRMTAAEIAELLEMALWPRAPISSGELPAQSIEFAGDLE
jgi:hypothetical protein